MLTYPMQDTGALPKYQYLYQRIRDDIIAGTIAGGTRLPSKRALAQHLGVGVITVANAYDLLVAEGYADARERSGHFVREDAAWPEMGAHNRNDAPPQSQASASASHGSIAPLATSAGEPSPGRNAPTHTPPPTDMRANRNSMRLFPAATWNKLMRRTIAQGGLFGTVPYNGLAVLRHAIAAYLRTSRGMQVDPGQIVIGAGTEYLYGRLAQLFGRTRIFGFEDPGYKKLASICGYMGCENRFIPIDGEGIRMEALEQSDVDVIHVSPANQFPTGSRMSVERRRELLAWTYRSSKRYIVEDDYDSEFLYRGGYLSPLFVQDDRDRVIYLNTFSKTLVPSLRISYMVLPPQLFERYRDSLSFYSGTVSSFEQYTLAQFIDQGYFERHISRLRTYYRRHRAQVLAALKASPLAQVSRVIEHNAGTHFLLEMDPSLSFERLRTQGDLTALGLSLYADYTSRPDALPTGLSDRTLMVNYAAIEPDAIEPTIAELVKLFPECCGDAPEPSPEPAV